MIRLKKPVHLDEELFRQWPSHVFIPHVVNVGTVEAFSGPLCERSDGFSMSACFRTFSEVIR
jgi:hypothetical protein